MDESEYSRDFKAGMSEQLDRDCMVFCEWCRYAILDDNPPNVAHVGEAFMREHQNWWSHQVTKTNDGGLFFVDCQAARLRAAIIERYGNKP